MLHLNTHRNFEKANLFKRVKKSKNYSPGDVDPPTAPGKKIVNYKVGPLFTFRIYHLEKGEYLIQGGDEKAKGF